MEVAPEAVESSSASARGFRVTDNVVVRAIARVPAPISAKQLFGSFVVAALLVLVAVLGLVALGQSNSRGSELLGLQRRATYEQLVLTDATQLHRAFVYLEAVAPHPNGSVSAFDQTIANDVSGLCNDAGIGSCFGTARTGLTLQQIDPALFTAIDDAIRTIFPTFAPQLGVVRMPYTPALNRAVRFTATLDRQMTALSRKTRARANELVAADHSSFVSSRNLLIGVSAGSLVLTLALGLLLSWSVVAPLRRTGGRLAEIGAGDFTGRLEVANRDEIGTLALRVNQTSDELQRVYRELELASERKSQYVTNMSHELRTPLNAIIGFSEVLHEQMFGELNERQLAYVNDVLEAARHLLSLINDLLDLAKIEAGRLELELSQVALPDLLRGAASMHAEQASRSGVELSLHTEPAEITITADKRRVRQIVFNLLSNAVKFTPAGGRVEISARAENGQVEIAIIDTGPGIAPEELETIFEEFEQTAEGKQAEGTGLGLPLSRKLAELHGGHLRAESTPGQGSTFRLALPVAAAALPPI
jgi:signal transduction histidine kinase